MAGVWGVWGGGGVREEHKSRDLKQKTHERKDCSVVATPQLLLVLFCLGAWPLSLAETATSIIFVATKDVFCLDKSMLVATKTCLSRQIVFCRDKDEFVATKHFFFFVVGLDKSMFVAT